MAYQQQQPYTADVDNTDQSDILAVFVEQNDNWIQKEENLNDSDKDVEAYERVLFSKVRL